MEGHCEWLQHFESHDQDLMCNKAPGISVYFSYFKYTLRDVLQQRVADGQPYT
jgi:hypothetical protein